MKTQKLPAVLAILALMVTSTSAMMNEDMKKGEATGEMIQVKTMTKLSTGEKTMSGEQVKIMDRNENKGSGSMKGSEINNASGTGAMKMEKAQGKKEAAKMKKEAAKVKAGKKAEKADEAMKNFSKRFENQGKHEKLNQYEALNAKIEKSMNKYLNSNISDAKKESYRNLFEYIKAVNNENIASLEEITEETE